MKKVFDKIKLTQPKKSAFDLSHERKLSCNMGDLVPVFLEEVLPNDEFSVNTEIMMRLAPMVAPVMHRVNVFMHFFYVPNRLVWKSWEDFITGGEDGTSAPVFPAVSADSPNVQNKPLMDYLGVPPQAIGQSSELKVSTLPIRGYQLIFNEYYRDQNLQDKIDIHTNDGLSLYDIRKRAWEKDYFTSCLPFAQKGPAAEVPISGDESTVTKFINLGGAPAWAGTEPVEANATSSSEADLRVGGTAAQIDLDGQGIDIHELRRTTAIQRFLEKMARGGSRYKEYLQNIFGSNAGDARLDRPEYLGGGRQPIVISEVLNTTGTTEAPQGDMSGHGISVGSKNRFRKTFKEHGYVIGIMSVMPRTAYQQGIHKHWTRHTEGKFGWYIPEFAHLGEQEVLNSEIFYDPDDDVYNDGVFGYQQRWAEYKYGCSTVHGDFRTNLDHWHMARIFATQPALNEDFITADPTNRIFAVQDGTDTLWVQMYHNVKARRPMPYFADPRL